MEASGVAGLLDKKRPPRLEDAGLEDCALPPDAIKEAFLKAASAVRSTVFSSFDDEDDDGVCLNDPWPRAGESSDALIGIAPAAGSPGACATEKWGSLHGSDVSDGLNDAEETVDKVVGPDVTPEAGEAYVDGLRGLKIGEKGIKGKKLKNSDKDEDEEDDEGESERPILVESHV